MMDEVAASGRANTEPRPGADAHAAKARTAYEASRFEESLAEVGRVIATITSDGPDAAASYLHPYADTWLAAATAAHPHDIPHQLAAGRNAWEVYRFLSQSPGLTGAQRARLAIGVQYTAGYLAFGSPTSDLAVAAFTLARALYEGLTDGDHRLDVAASWSSQAMHHHLISFHPAQPDPAAEQARQRAAAAQAAVILDPIAESLPDPAIGPPELQRMADLFSWLIGLLTFGGADSAPSVQAVVHAKLVYAAMTDRDHRIDVASCLTSLSLRHHETSFHPVCPDPAAEQARQRAAAAEAADLVFPIAEAAPMPGLAAADVLRVAGLLDRLIGLLTFGGPESAPSVRATELAGQAYAALVDRDHRIDIASSLTGLSLRHHETSFQPACPDPAAEQAHQRAAAAEAASLVFAIADPPAESLLSGADLGRAAGILDRLAGLVAFGASGADLPGVEALAQRAADLRDRIRELLAGIAGAVAAAEAAVVRDEEQAGIRPAGSADPVDYERLAEFTPNPFWGPPHLVTALSELAFAYQHAGRTAEAVAAMGRRALAYRRLAGADPAAHRPGLAQALVGQSRFLQVAGALAEAVPPGEEAVIVQEELAGIRPAGGHDPVNYSHLAGAVPNGYWAAPHLLDGLANLAHAYRRAGLPLDGLAIMGNRAGAYERLAIDDLALHEAGLTAAREDENVFWRTAGMPPEPSAGVPDPEPPAHLSTGPVAALSRNSNQLDIFAVAEDGGVWSAWWNGEPWRDWFRIGARAFGPRTPIATLSRNSDQMDVFAVGLDGGVYSAWWNGNPWRDWFRVGTRTFTQNTPISALSRNDDQMDLFAVGEDGGVYSAWWNGDWHDWFRIGTAVFAQGTPIAVLSRNPDQMDLFAVGLDGRVWSAWWNGVWHDWFPIGDRTFAQGTPIAALSRNPDQMDLFAVGLDGGMWSAWWNGNPWRDWFRIGTAVFAQGTPIAALSRNPDQMDVFAVGLDGGVWSAWWNGNPWREWFRLGGGEFGQGTPIAALARDADHMDLFAVGRDGRVFTATWNGNPWRGWFPISIVRPRPFYIVGHNPNSLAEARADLEAGANALEPDVQTYRSSPLLCVSHGPGGGDAPTLEEYLTGLHSLAVEFPQLALIVFDCKEPVTSPEHGLELLTAIREHLTYDNDLNVIISIASRDDHQDAFFDHIVDRLGPREGLMIDYENDPGSVSNYFTGRGVVNQGYGNGISFFNRLIGPYYRYTLEAACALRAQAGRPRFIYVWTTNTDNAMREYIRIGVDGIITDDLADLRGIIGEPEAASLVRLATRADNPFQPANRAYGLTVHTTNKWMAGTDANVTFTLTGALGTVSKTINTDLIKRMESDRWNHVTIPSNDLGPLTSVSVRRDDSGNAPDWHLGRITVASARYGTHAEAVFDRWIDTTDLYTVNL
ncbi:PLAT/LH2 domain-containing protein [Actinocorallia longicatena]|uniref:PLAT domain-containing protein n=1 Tax=Actinocorallia longicatena TaxID=111803 RepID=A0ABP6PXF5_9ACTN